MRNVMRGAGLIAAGLLCGACVTVPAPAPATAARDAEYHRPPGNDYEAAFVKEDGVLPIRWGGWMKPVVAGTGAAPTVEDKVTVNYRGTLTDGTEFDSSYKRGRPATFPLSGVIPCWTNGMMMMRVGGKAKFVCPAAVAYGDAGSPPAIPGGATLVFEIELLDVVR
ncbi:MAG: FKBP-type peptidyl-prolyl cis-trans isomerase [Elusimicrobia bacterium]|nr:FKBP-type peptidyl-prolyl cis-trans isomerase [Elusimicrobiota bacterium]